MTIYDALSRAIQGATIIIAPVLVFVLFMLWIAHELPEAIGGIADVFTRGELSADGIAERLEERK